MGTKITPFNLHTSVDSHVKGLIDSDYVQARSGSGGTDSASTQAMIDSNFTNMDIDIHMPDNQKITFGADSDLEIMHLGTYSRIRDKGTGNLVLAVDDLQVTNSAVTENILIAKEDGAVELYNNNVKKIETTDSGGKITGNIAANIRSNPKGFSVTHTVDSTDNALLVGPINVDSGVTLTINGTLMVV